MLTEPTGPVTRYERRHAGEIIHIDIKKLARIERMGHRIHGDRSARNRGAGGEYVHVAVDDATRLAYVEVLANERAASIVGFLERALCWFAARGVRAQRVMTDNGSGYVLHLHADACRRLGVRHLRTRPYRPQTNGKGERFIQTLTRGWAYRADLSLLGRAPGRARPMARPVEPFATPCRRQPADAGRTPSPATD